MIIRLFISLFLIVVVSTTAFASTRALLSDEVTLTANTFSTGTVDLQITTGTGSDYAETHAGFSGTLLPGQTTNKFVKLRNNGSGVAMTIAAQAANLAGIPGNKVVVSFTPWTSGSLSGHIEDGAITTTHTLTEWATTPTDLGNPTLGSGNIQYYKMDVTIDPSVTTSGSTNFDFVFTGTQVTS